MDFTTCPWSDFGIHAAGTRVRPWMGDNGIAPDHRSNVSHSTGPVEPYLALVLDRYPPGQTDPGPAGADNGVNDIISPP